MILKGLGILGELTKIRLVLLVLFSAFAGFFIASADGFVWERFIWMLGGMGFAAAGSMAMNQWMERREDALMTRTQNRPIPGGAIAPEKAFWTAVSFLALGIGLLAWKLPACAALTMLTAAIYLFIYTPLKKKTTLNTLVGAVPGALPPVAGWAAATGQAPAGAWLLFGLMFFWQLPHFLAISWVWREDYKRAGFTMLSVRDSGGNEVKQQIVLYTLALVPVSLAPVMIGQASGFYLFGALLAGIFFAFKAGQSFLDFNRRAMTFFLSSLVYLPVVFVFMMLDKKL